jgi:hypothetical protein
MKFFKESNNLRYPFHSKSIAINAINNGTYRYAFQGQEKDDEIKGEGNSVNYTYRMHDTRLGRFFAVDPLHKEFPWNSCYAFSENRVIDGLEIEGLEVRTLGEIAAANVINMHIANYKVAVRHEDLEAQKRIQNEFDRDIQKIKLEPSNKYVIEMRIAEVSVGGTGTFVKTRILTEEGGGTYLNGRTIVSKDAGLGIGVGAKVGVKGSVLSGEITLSKANNEGRESPELTIGRAESGFGIGAHIATPIGGNETLIISGSERTQGTTQRHVFSGYVSGFSGGASIGTGASITFPLEYNIPSLTKTDSMQSVRDNFAYGWAQDKAKETGWSNRKNSYSLDSLVNNKKDKP